MDQTRPTVVCLCGSTRYKWHFIKANFHETMNGKIVLSVGFFGHSDGDVWHLSVDEKTMLDDLHKRKIDMSDEILVIDVDGYCGESTESEIRYATEKGKVIRYLSVEYTGLWATKISAIDALIEAKKKISRAIDRLKDTDEKQEKDIGCSIF